MSVEPARGRPTMKIGARSGSPAPARCRKKSAVIKLTHALESSRRLVGAVRNFFQTQRVPARVVAERRRVFAAIFQRLADGEFEMQAVFVVEVRARDRLPHRLQLFVAETERLQIREAPVRLAELRIDPCAHRVRMNRAIVMTGGLQRMAATEPDRSLIRIFAQQRFVDFDGGLVVADSA